LVRKDPEMFDLLFKTFSSTSTTFSPLFLDILYSIEGHQFVINFIMERLLRESQTTTTESIIFFFSFLFFPLFFLFLKKFIILAGFILAFRSNHLSLKLVEIFLKKNGSNYLKATLKATLESIVNLKEPYEVFNFFCTHPQPKSFFFFLKKKIT